MRDRAQRRERVFGNERRGRTAGEGVLAEVGSRADSNEEVSLLDAPGVDLDARDLRRPRRPLQLPGRKLLDSVERDALRRLGAKA